MIVHVVYPSARPSEVLPAIQRARSTTSVDIQWLVVFHDSPPVDLSAALLRSGVEVLSVPRTPASCLVEAVNAGYGRIREFRKPAASDLIGYWSDDFYPEPGWLEELIKHARPCCLMQPEDVSGVRINGLPQCATAPFGTFSFWEERNGGHLFNPLYRRWWCDCEIVLIAQRYGEFIFVPTARVVHRHWTRRMRPKDTLDHAAWKDFHAERELYNRRLVNFQ